MSLRRRKRSISDLREKLNRYQQENDPGALDDFWGKEDDHDKDETNGNFWLRQFIPLTPREQIVKIGVSLLVLLLVLVSHGMDHPWVNSALNHLDYTLNWEALNDLRSPNGIPVIEEGLDSLGSSTEKSEETNHVSTKETVPLPVEGEWLSLFGLRETTMSDEEEATKEMHYGIDWGSEEGAEVITPWAGVVESVNEKEEDGAFSLTLQHQEEWSTHYRGLGELLVEPGDQLEAGEIVGKLGSPGRWEKPHLHFELRWEQRPVDPLFYVSGWEESIQDSEEK